MYRCMEEGVTLGVSISIRLIAIAGCRLQPKEKCATFQAGRDRCRSAAGTIDLVRSVGWAHLVSYSLVT